MQIRTRLFAALAFAALAATSAVAAPLNMTVDKSHSEVGFDVRHLFAKVHGRFNDFSADIVLDQANLANSSVNATVQAATIWTDNERRDGHLKSEDFFAAEKYPTLTFKSTKIAPAGKDKFKMTGDLTMRGVTKSVTFDGEILGVGAVGVGGQSWGTRGGFTATTVINRKDFGINWNKTLDNGGLMLSDEVTITLNIEAQEKQPEKK